MEKFEILDHTADTGLLLYSSDLAGIFSAAARGMTHLLIEGEIKKSHTRNLEISSDRMEDLLYDWLSEINYLFQVEQMIFSEFVVEKIDNNHLQALLRGEHIDLDRHICCTEIKAITYHQLYIKQLEGQWQAQVIFDL